MTRTAVLIGFMVVIAWWAAAPSRACVALRAPVEGPIVAGFAPTSSYAGHWGVDYATELGEPVRAAESGTVTWSGLVVDNLAVTVHHGGGLRTSYSYLSEALLSVGDRVPAGQIIGLGSSDHLHFSVRIDDRYIDPAAVLSCMEGEISSGLSLVPVSYPAADATRHSRGDVRSAAHRPSGRR